MSRHSGHGATKSDQNLPSACKTRPGSRYSLLETYTTTNRRWIMASAALVSTQDYFKNSRADTRSSIQIPVLTTHSQSDLKKLIPSARKRSWTTLTRLTLAVVTTGLIASFAPWRMLPVKAVAAESQSSDALRTVT